MEILLMIDVQNDFIDGALGTKEAQDMVWRLEDYLENSKCDRIIATMDTHFELNAYPLGLSSNPNDIMVVYGNGKLHTDAFSLNVKNIPIIWERKSEKVYLEEVIGDIQEKYGDEIILTCRDAKTKELVKNMILRLECEQ